MSSYERWGYNPETRTIFAPDIEDGLTLATVEPYDDADDIGRLIMAAPEMYELLKDLLQSGNLFVTDEDRVIELLERIDGGTECYE